MSAPVDPRPAPAAVQPREASAAGSADVRIFAGFAMMCLGMFMAILDVQVVATSLPTIQGALAIGQDQISWVQTAYLIAEVVAIPLTGPATRMLGMRRMFVIAVSLFTAASVLCAFSTGFSALIAARVLQGLAGGTLIPAVFSAVFLLFPVRLQGPATTMAGVVAVLAPTVGPIAGGWITATYSWHWLFLVNLAPGILAAAGAALLLPRDPPARRFGQGLDVAALVLLALALASLEIALKQAPDRGWLSVPVAGLLATTAVGGLLFSRRTLRRAEPLVDIAMFADRNFAIGCALSFVLGVGLFGSVYLMPIFLGYVRGHDALQIGLVMLVTGGAQLASAPLAVALERRVDPRVLTCLGFAVFGVGLLLGARQTIDTDFAQMFWPQVLRGSAIMFCILPPTRLALGHLPADRVPDASGLFNLMRNLGGAIGLAVIDTIIYGLAPTRGEAILGRLRAGDVAAAQAIGITPDMMAAGPGALDDPSIVDLVRPLVERGAFVDVTNVAWAVVGTLTLLALALVPFGRWSAPGSDEARHGP